MSESEIIEALAARDGAVTQQFFFEDCRPLFLSIMRHVFTYAVDYDEFVNEFYIHLMEDDARRLRQFSGRSTLYQWLKIVAIRYFIDRHSRMIDMSPKETLSTERAARRETDEKADCRLDIESLLERLDNRRYADIIRRLVLNDAEPEAVARELGITTANLYNIKKRAIAALTAAALEDVRLYERERI